MESSIGPKSPNGSPVSKSKDIPPLKENTDHPSVIVEQGTIASRPPNSTVIHYDYSGIQSRLGAISSAEPPASKPEYHIVTEFDGGDSQDERIYSHDIEGPKYVYINRDVNLMKESGLVGQHEREHHHEQEDLAPSRVVLLNALPDNYRENDGAILLHKDDVYVKLEKESESPPRREIKSERVDVVGKESPLVSEHMVIHGTGVVKRQYNEEVTRGVLKQAQKNFDEYLAMGSSNQINEEDSLVAMNPSASTLKSLHGYEFTNSSEVPNNYTQLESVPVASGFNAIWTPMGYNYATKGEGDFQNIKLESLYPQVKSESVDRSPTSLGNTFELSTGQNSQYSYSPSPSNNQVPIQFLQGKSTDTSAWSINLPSATDYTSQLSANAVILSPEDSQTAHKLGLTQAYNTYPGALSAWNSFGESQPYVLDYQRQRDEVDNKKACMECNHRGGNGWSLEDRSPYVCSQCPPLCHGLKSNKVPPAKRVNTSKRNGLSCANCHTNTTTLWRRNNQGEPVCNACGLYFKLHQVNRPIAMKKDSIQTRKRKSKAATDDKVKTVKTISHLDSIKEPTQHHSSMINLEYTPYTAPQIPSCIQSGHPYGSNNRASLPSYESTLRHASPTAVPQSRIIDLMPNFEHNANVASMVTVSSPSTLPEGSYLCMDDKTIRIRQAQHEEHQ